jgi:hypothetical protein
VIKKKKKELIRTKKVRRVDERDIDEAMKLRKKNTIEKLNLKKKKVN